MVFLHMSQNNSASEQSLVGHDRVCTLVQGILRSALLKGWSDAQLHEQSGVSARAIKSYRVEGKEPSLSNALSLAVVLGPSAINTILSTIGYVARPLDEAEAACPHKMVADGLAAFSVIASAAADGRIDHIEAPMCKDAADRVIAAVLPLSSAGGAA